MTKAGLRLEWLGETFTWVDLRDFINHLPPSGDSAVYRQMYPQSWWWQPEFDFLSAILNAMQWGNWQRGGGKGDKPKAIVRPKENSKAGPKTVDELAARVRAVKRRTEVKNDG